MKKTIILIPAILMMMLLLTGCDLLSVLMAISCMFNPDPGHCYQSAAVQGSDEDECEKVTPPPEYKAAGSNPPKDKCYLMIAQNTGEYGPCDKIVGGAGSYTRDECIEGIAIDKGDPSGCKKLTGASFNDCKEKLGATITVDKIKGVDDKIGELTDKLKNNPDDKKLRTELDTLTKQRDDLVDFSAGGVKQQYTRGRVDEVIGDVDDSDVASTIRQEYIKYKQTHQGEGIDKLMDKLKDIKEEQEFVKRADDAANTLVDQLKEKVTEYSDEKKQELIDAATEKGWGYVKENSGDRLKYYLNRMEESKEKYDKGSEKFQEYTKKIDKIKKAYDEVMGVYKKIDETNKLLAQGKIEKGHAQVIKGAILLGKGLEYATAYVPVFGSTVSTISKETFEATVKLAQKRAQRTTAINKCIDDPEHCDPNSISAY